MPKIAVFGTIGFKMEVTGHGFFCMRFKSVFFCVFAIISNCYAGPSESDFNSEAPVQRLKEFMSHPPVIRQIAFEYCNFVGKTNFYLLRWQTNALLLQQFQSLESLDSGTKSDVVNANGFFNDSYWAYSGQMGLSLYQRTSASMAGEKTNGIYTSCQVALDLSSWVMNMGVPNQDIGSIVWSDDEFAITNQRGVVWSGYLEMASNAVPSGVSLTSNRLTNSVKHTERIDYKYGLRSQESGLPEEFEELTMIDSHWLRMGAFKLFQVVATNTSQPADFFSLSGPGLGNSRLWVYTNNQMLVSISGDPNSMVPVHYVLPGTTEDPYHGVNYNIRRFEWFLLASFFNLILISSVIIYFRRQLSIKNETKKDNL